MHERLKALWENVGLGDPRLPYTNNPNSANAWIMENITRQSLKDV